VELDTIKEILKNPDFDEKKALMEQRIRLIEKRKQLDLLISNIEKSIAAKEGGITMSDKEKFEGFKNAIIEDNEKKFGKEIREKYGDEAVNRSNKKLKNMSKEEYEEIKKLEEDILMSLKEAFNTGDPSSELAQKTAEMHGKWISFYWDSYNKEAHANLAKMYVCDERFKAYYDKNQPGLAQFLRDSVLIYTGTKE
jgi:hypothetical protein